MLDPSLLRDRPADVEERLKGRGPTLGQDLRWLQRLDAERREILPVLENARRSRKEVSEQIARAKQAGEPDDHLRSAGQIYSSQIEEQEAKLTKVERERRDILLRLPNLPHVSVPEGTSAADNQEVRRHGEPPVFDFSPKAHWDLGPSLGVLDFERAAKLAGARFAVLLGAGARMERALINFMLDLHTGEHGYKEVAPPFLANAGALLGTGNLPKFEADLFKIAGDSNLYLIPTAEVPLANLHRGEILDGRRLPFSYVAYTPCFRREAGSYGADVRGLIRQHQFDKVELVKYTTPDQSYEALEALTGHAEEVLKRLGASGPGHVPGDLVVQQYRGLSGPAGEHQVQTGRDWKGRVRAHAQRLWARRRPHAHCDSGKLSAARWIGGGSRRASTLDGWAGSD
jgi:seryl-tRNA synthetase